MSGAMSHRLAGFAVTSRRERGLGLPSAWPGGEIPLTHLYAPVAAFLLAYGNIFAGAAETR